MLPLRRYYVTPVSILAVNRGIACTLPINNDYTLVHGRDHRVHVKFDCMSEINSL